LEQPYYLILLTVVVITRGALTSDSATRLMAVPVAFMRTQEGKYEKCNGSSVYVIDPWLHVGIPAEHRGDRGISMRATLVPVMLKNR
jgi:hypothetical protein